MPDIWPRIELQRKFLMSVWGQCQHYIQYCKEIAKYFGIDESVAKDVAKTLVLRVLNGGSVTAWCREMGIDAPTEDQADLRDLAEVARIVRDAFFAKLEREQPGALTTLKASVAATLRDAHQRRVQDAQRKGEAPPQPLGAAAHDRGQLDHRSTTGQPALHREGGRLLAASAADLHRRRVRAAGLVAGRLPDCLRGADANRPAPAPDSTGRHRPARVASLNVGGSQAPLVPPAVTHRLLF